MSSNRISLSFGWSERLRDLIAERADDFFSMSLVGDEAIACQNAANQGIDAHLEACYVPDRGDEYKVTPRTFVAQDDNPPHWSKGQVVTHTRALNCRVSKLSLPVLVRRLLESGDEAAECLGSSICDSLNIELM